MFNLKNKVTGELLLEYTGRYFTTRDPQKALALSQAELDAFNRAHGPHWEAVKAAKKKPPVDPTQPDAEKTETP